MNRVLKLLHIGRERGMLFFKDNRFIRQKKIGKTHHCDINPKEKKC